MLPRTVLSWVFVAGLALPIQADDASSPPADTLEGFDLGSFLNVPAELISAVERMELRRQADKAGTALDREREIVLLRELLERMEVDGVPVSEQFGPLDQLARELQASDRLEEAQAVRRKLLEHCQSEHGAVDWRTVDAGYALQIVDTLLTLDDQERPQLLSADVNSDGVIEPQFVPFDEAAAEQAARERERVRESTRAAFGRAHPAYLRLLRMESDYLDFPVTNEDFADRDDQLRKFRDLVQTTYEQPHPLKVFADVQLAANAVHSQRFDAVEPLLRQASRELQELEEIPPQFQWGYQLGSLPDLLTQEVDRLLQSGQTARAFALNEVHLECLQTLHGDDSPEIRNARLNEVWNRRLYQLSNTEVAKYNEAGLLWEQANSLADNGDDTAAAAALTRAADLYTDVMGPHASIGVSRDELLAGFAYNQQDFDSALELLGSAIRSSRDAYGNDSSRARESWWQFNRWAHEYSAVESESGRFATARDALNGAYQLSLERSGEEHWETRGLLDERDEMDRRSRLGMEDQKLLAAADAGMERFAELAAQDYSGEFGFTVAALIDERGAIEAAEEALELREQVLGPVAPSVISTAAALANVHVIRGDFDRAFPLFEQVLDAARRNYGVLSQRYVDLLHEFGLACSELGESASGAAISRRSEALRHLTPDLRIFEYTSSPAYMTASTAQIDDEEVRFLSDLAREQANIGQYAQAVDAYQKILRGLEIRQDAENAGDASVLSNLGKLYAELGDFARAERFFSEALRILDGLDSEPASTGLAMRHNLALLNERAGADETAAKTLRDTLAWLDENSEVEAVQAAHILSSLGYVYHKLGRLESADEACSAALQELRRPENDDHEALPALLGSYGLLHLARRRFDEAEALMEEARAIRNARHGPQHWSTAESLADLALLSAARGEWNEAVKRVSQAVRIAAVNLEDAMVMQSERQQLAMIELLRRHLDLYLSLSTLGELPPDGVYEESLRWKGIVHARHMERLLRLDDPQLTELTSRLRWSAQSLASFALYGFDDTVEARHARLVELVEGKEQIEADLSRRLTELRRAESSADQVLPGMRDALPENSVLIDLYEYRRVDPHSGVLFDSLAPRHLTAFVVRRDGPLARVELGPAEPIDAAIATWRQAVSRRQQAPAEAERALRELVWQPLAGLLRPEERLLIAPEGALAEFPCAALPIRPGAFLIEDRSVAIVPVPRLLSDILDAGDPAVGSERGPSLLLIGDVDFSAYVQHDEEPLVAVADDRPPTRDAGPLGSDCLRDWSNLTGTRAEILLIRDIFEQQFGEGLVRSRRSAAPSEMRVREELPAFRWAHIATHGFFGDCAAEESSRLRSGLERWHPGVLAGIVLAGVNQVSSPWLDDGILTAAEVAEMDLRGLETIVLSACETGLGTRHRGEGVLGLQRAFHLAGAETVIATLWKVDDRTTSLLMEYFYENVWTHDMDKLDALRAAQLAVMEDPQIRGAGRTGQASDEEPGIPSPYFWAGFTLSGDWR